MRQATDAQRGALPGENNGGGPATPEGLERAKQNLQPSPLANTKHGLKRFLSSGGAIAPPCRFCIIIRNGGTCESFRPGEATCQIAEDYQQQVQTDLQKLPQMQAEDECLISEYAKYATALLILSLYIANAGPMTTTEEGTLDLQPVVKERTKISAHLLKIGEALGLSPAARAKLKIGAGGGGGRTWAAAVLEAAVLEADFTAEDANGIRSQPASGGDPVSGEGEGRAGDGGDG